MPALESPALTDWPTVNPTEATVPAMGLVNWAEARSCCASISEALAESMAAWSVANCSALLVAVPVEPLPPALVPLPPLDAVLVEPDVVVVAPVAPAATSRRSPSRTNPHPSYRSRSCPTGWRPPR